MTGTYSIRLVQPKHNESARSVKALQPVVPRERHHEASSHPQFRFSGFKLDRLDVVPELEKDRVNGGEAKLDGVNRTNTKIIFIFESSPVKNRHRSQYFSYNFAATSSKTSTDFLFQRMKPNGN